MCMLSGDIMNRFGGRRELISTEKATKYMLCKIPKALSTMSTISLEKLRLPPAPDHVDLLKTEPAECSENRVLQMALESIFFQWRSETYLHRGDEHSHAWFSKNHLHAELLSPFIRDRVFFSDFSERTGKTFVASAVYRILKPKERHFATVASSTVTTQLLYHCQASYSAFQILLWTDQESMCTMLADSLLADSRRKTDLFIWAEILMTYRYDLKASVRTLLDTIRCNLPFGRNVALLIGYFHPILTIVPVENRS